ncbi:MAG: hypothetical protein HYU57_00185 [Micavibrio aeruginosavorus]|nr:hypothetical protein [Micavibrio aeruginosavorus]
MMNGFLKHLFVATFLCATLLGAHSASAAILWAGGEEMDFTIEGVGGIKGTSNTTYFDNTFSRQGVAPNTASEFLKTGVFANSSLFWVRFRHILDSGGACDANKDWIKFTDSAGVDRLILRPTTASATPLISINKRDAAGTVTLLGTSTGNIDMNPQHTYDVFINYAAAGEITIYMNGNQIGTYSGDVTTDGQTSLAQIKLGSCQTSSTTFYSQVIVSTTDSRLMRLLTRAPVANGNTMAWTGAVSDINENILSELNLISSSTAGQLAQFTVPATLPVSSNWAVQAVVQSGRLLRSTTGPQNFRFSLRTGGVDYTSPSDIPLELGYENFSYVWNTNPNTSAAWTSSQVTAATFNLGVKSQP